jgi:hypothetical protein
MLIHALVINCFLRLVAKSELSLSPEISKGTGRVLVGKPELQRPFGRTRRRGLIIIKCTFKT